MSVFIVNHEFDAILNPDAVKLTEHLQNCNAKELLYIILAYDYTQSPFRMKPAEERINMAKKRIWNKMTVYPETERVKKAIEEYKSLIFDVKRETIDNYKSKIQKLQRQSLYDDVSVTKLKELDAAIQFLQKRINELESEVLMDEKYDAYIKGNKKLSFIERWQMNIKKYKEYKEGM